MIISMTPTLIYIKDKMAVVRNKKLHNSLFDQKIIDQMVENITDSMMQVMQQVETQESKVVEENIVKPLKEMEEFVSKCGKILEEKVEQYIEEVSPNLVLELEWDKSLDLKSFIDHEGTLTEEPVKDKEEETQTITFEDVAQKVSFDLELPKDLHLEPFSDGGVSFTVSDEKFSEAEIKELAVLEPIVLVQTSDIEKPTLQDLENIAKDIENKTLSEDYKVEYIEAKLEVPEELEQQEEVEQSLESEEPVKEGKTQRTRRVKKTRVKPARKPLK